MANDTTYTGAGFEAAPMGETELKTQTLDPSVAAQMAMSGMAASRSTAEGANNFLGQRIAAGPLSPMDVAIAQADAKAKEEALEYARVEEERRRRHQELFAAAAAKAAKDNVAKTIESLSIDPEKITAWRMARKAGASVASLAQSAPKVASIHGGGPRP